MVVSPLKLDTVTKKSRSRTGFDDESRRTNRLRGTFTDGVRKTETHAARLIFPPNSATAVRDGNERLALRSTEVALQGLPTRNERPRNLKAPESRALRLASRAIQSTLKRSDRIAEGLQNVIVLRRMRERQRPASILWVKTRRSAGLKHSRREQNGVPYCGSGTSNTRESENRYRASENYEARANSSKYLRVLRNEQRAKFQTECRDHESIIASNGEPAGSSSIQASRLRTLLTLTFRRFFVELEKVP